MSTMFAPQINEVDRKTNQSFAGKSVETAGPLAMLPTTPMMFGDESYDDFSSSNPFAQGTIDYSMYSESPMASTVSESSYAIAMSSFVSAGGMGDMGGDFSSDSGFSSGMSSDGGFSGGGMCSGGGCGGGFSGGSSGGFTASC